jgi:hypothetical protein
VPVHDHISGLDHSLARLFFHDHANFAAEKVWDIVDDIYRTRFRFDQIKAAAVYVLHGDQ